MVDQEWFIESYPKTKKKIKVTDEDFQGQLIIEDYPELEEIYLHDVESIDKIVLKNLPQLQKCTIWNCGTKDLVAENCPQLKTLNVRSNYLTNLEFVVDLEHLEELEIDGNSEIDSGLEYLPKNLEEFSCDGTKMAEVLKQNPYQGN